MKRLRNISATAIRGAEDSRPTLDDAIDNLNDDFDYIVGGLEKLGRDGVNASNQALAMAETISAALQSYIQELAGLMAQPK